MYIVRMLECTSQILKNLSKMLQQYSKLCLPCQYAKESQAGRYMLKYRTHRSCTPPHCRLFPERDGPVILISGCITYRRILNSWIINMMTLR